MSDKIECPVCNEFYRMPEIVIYACCLQQLCTSCCQKLIKKYDTSNTKPPCPYCRAPLIYYNNPEYLSKLLYWSEKDKILANYCLGDYYLGDYYQCVEGVEGVEGVEKSIHYYTLVATSKQEEPYWSLSLFKLGIIFKVRKDYEKALHYFKLAADYGRAYYTIGFMYKYGLGVTQSYEKAFQYYKIAADKGEEMAQFNVGICYYDGEGVVKDNVLAIEYLTLSADQGYEEAIKILPVVLIEHEYPRFEILYSIKNALVLMKESDSYFTNFEDILERSNKFCGSCHSRIYKSLHCGKCKIIYYCNFECQKRHWKEGGHKQECK